MPYVEYWESVGGGYMPKLVSTHGFKLTPFVKELIRPTYFYRQTTTVLDGNVFVFSGGSFWGEQIPDDEMSMEAYSRAYAKFQQKCYTQAATLTALKERAKTVDMVYARLKQVWKGATALRKGNFRGFLSTFGIKAKPKHANKIWSRPKDFGGLWLEYWMGWAPTVGDIYNCVEFLSKSVPSEPIRAGSSNPFESNFVNYGGGGKFATTDNVGTQSVWIQAMVEVTNPTLFDFQGLGLMNPAKTVWETIPFSWFVDWFTNIGQILGQVTDWLGLQLKDLQVSWKTKFRSSWRCTPGYDFGVDVAFREREIVRFERKPSSSLPWITPIARIPNGLSLTRAATLASLLVTMFAPSKTRR